MVPLLAMSQGSGPSQWSLGLTWTLLLGCSATVSVALTGPRAAIPSFFRVLSNFYYPIPHILIPWCNS